jgi:hypothetical protein
MRSTKGGSTLDAAFRGFYSAFSCPLLSRRFSSRHGEERAGYIIYSPECDSPQMYACHLSQCGVDFVVITVWLVHERIQSSARCKADKGLLKLIGALE